MKIALVHDYLTQRGGAERVVHSLHRAFPEAPIYTSLYDRDGTFEELSSADVRPLPLDRVALLRRHHRLALPFLGPSFDRLVVDADVAICSSSGWAHRARVTGYKIVYCHTPARWLYQRERYLGEHGSIGARLALRTLSPALRRADARAARGADRYVANSTVVQARIRELYGIEAEVVPPPPAVSPSGERRPLPGVEGGFLLCVARLLPYKNVAPVVAAFRSLPHERLVVAGDGPELAGLRRSAPANVTLAGSVSDAVLRWLYAECSGVVAAAYEDFGLTPLEGASFGRPAAALRFGGFLDTVVEAETGVFFDRPEPAEVAAAIGRLRAAGWDPASIRAHAATFAEARFHDRLRRLVEDLPKARVEA